MENNQLLQYITQRTQEGNNLTSIKNELIQYQHLSEEEINNALQELIKRNLNPQNNNFNQSKNIRFSYIMLGIGTTLLIIGNSAINARNNKFPSFLGFLLIITGIIFYIGPDKVKAALLELQKSQKKRM